MLNCIFMNLPFKYLGVPIGGNHNRLIFWNGLIDKVRKKLLRWKGKFIYVVAPQEKSYLETNF